MAGNIVKPTGFDRSQIDEIKSRISIEDVVSRYVRLKPSGKNLFGLCPFHKEDTPSFSVNPEMQIFKCFGCGEGGDVFTFLEKIENLEFKEVLSLLADEAGIKLKYTQRDPKESEKFNKANESHKLASNFYSKVLKESKLGEKARNYIKKRKFSQKAINEFKIGYAPRLTNGRALSNYLSKHKCTEKDLIDLGLAVERDGKIVDKFVDRLMFPILDQSGRTIAFSGRILGKDKDRPKYLNSPETIIFQKRRNLFGFYQARQSIRKHKYTILVEGQTDVISSWQAGIKNIVAPLGTGVTTEQLEKLKKITPDLILAFDSDSAGLRAIMRTALLALNKEMNVYASQILYGQDADECIKKDKGLWEKTIEKRIPVVSFFLNIIAQKYSPKSLNGKKAIIEKIWPLMLSLKDNVTKEHHIKEISNLTEISEEILRETLTGKGVENIEASIKSTLPPKKEIPTEAYLLAMILQYSQELKNEIIDIDAEIIQNNNIKKAIKNAIDQIINQKELNIESIKKKLSEKGASILQDSAMRPIWSEKPLIKDLIIEFEDTVKKLTVDLVKNEISQLREKLTITEQKGNTKISNEILNKVNQKIEELDKLTRS